MSQQTSAIARFFEFEQRGTTLAREVRGGIATFLTMAYILFANPGILAAAGVPVESAVACTALAAGICSILMGLFANFPMAMASGMGLNAIVAFTIAKSAGTWQAAMGLVVLDGIVITLLVLVGLREAVMAAIPRDLRRAIGAGIGLFIAFIGLVNARLVVVPAGTAAALSQDPNASLPPVTFGSLHNPSCWVALLGLVVTAYLVIRRIPGALILGILFGTVLGLLTGLSRVPAQLAAPSFDVAFQADLGAALNVALVPLLLSLVMVDFFDTLGTSTAVAEQARLVDAEGRIPRFRSLLLVDSVSAAIGGLLGVSSVTAYVESASGVAEGARTGLHTVVVGLLFLLSILVAPVAGMVPAAATAPALIMVGFLMMLEVSRIDFEELETAIPAFITLLMLPLTYSISHGIGYGFLTYVLIKVLRGRFSEVHPLLYVISVAFAAYFLWGAA